MIAHIITLTALSTTQLRKDVEIRAVVSACPNGYRIPVTRAQIAVQPSIQVDLRTILLVLAENAVVNFKTLPICLLSTGMALEDLCGDFFCYDDAPFHL